MTDHSRLLMLGVVVVAFIAGYAIVSYVVRKLKEGPFNPALTDQSRQGSDPKIEDNSALDSETGNTYKRSDHEG